MSVTGKIREVSVKTKKLTPLQLTLLLALSRDEYRMPPLSTVASTVLSLSDRGCIKIRAPVSHGLFVTWNRHLLKLTPYGLRSLTCVLEHDIVVLCLSWRVRNYLTVKGIWTLGDLVRRTKRQLKRMRGLGRVSFREITGKLSRMGLGLRP